MMSGTGVRQERGQGLVRAFCAGMALVCLVFLLRLALTVDLQVVYDYDEGWNAYHAHEAVHGINPYPPAGSFMYNNYPPLSFYVVGSLGWLLGDDIVAGRIISLLAFLAAMSMIGLACLRLGCNRREAVFAGLLAATILLADYNYIGVNDPQILGHAFQLGGLLLLAGPRSSARLALAAVLLAAGFFVKHVLVLLPLAATLWLLLVDRRAGLRLVLYGLAIGCAGAVLFQLAFGQSLWSQIASPRQYVLAHSWAGLLGWLQVSGLPLVAALWAGYRFRKDPALCFGLIYLAAALIFGFYFMGGAGTSGNVMFDALIALALLGGLGLNRFGAERPRTAMIYGAAHALPLAGLLLLHTVSDSFYPRYWLDREAEAVRDARSNIAFLQSRPGPAICTMLALCYWAGKPAEVDMGMMRQAILTGRRDGTDLEQAIAARKFSVIESGFEVGPRVDASLRAHYRLHHRDSAGWFWVPR